MISAPTPDKEMEKTLENIEMDINSIKIKIQLSYTISTLSILVEESNTLLKNEYLLENNLSSLQKYDKYFKYFETTEELAKSINESLKDKSINVILNNNKCELEINNPILKTKFRLNIPVKEKNLKDELSNIIPYIKQLNLRIEKLEKENIELKKNVEFLMKKNEENEKNEKNEKDNLFRESNIITSESKNIILNFLKNKPVKSKLLFDSEKDGDSAKTFHSKCDGKNPTIYIVKSKSGYVFGGYLSIPWSSISKHFRDDEAFFFSINLNKKYYFTNKNKVIYGNKDYGPVICGGIRMDVCNNALSSWNNFIELEDEKLGSKYEINGGIKKIDVQSYEVHQLEY